MTEKSIEEVLDLVSELNDLAQVGLSVKMTGNWVFSIDGFFKHGEVQVDLKNNSIECRYNEIIYFEDKDLIHTLLKLADKLCKEYYGKEANYLDYYNWRSIYDYL